MERPRLKLTNNTPEKSDPITYSIEGNLIHAVTLEITPKQSVFFEHHLMSWTIPSLNIVKPKFNHRFKRGFGGIQLISLETNG